MNEGSAMEQEQFSDHQSGEDWARIYEKHIRFYPLLTEAEERALAEEIKRHRSERKGQQAMHKLINSNLRNSCTDLCSMFFERERHEECSREAHEGLVYFESRLPSLDSSDIPYFLDLSLDLFELYASSLLRLGRYKEAYETHLPRPRKAPPR